MEKKQLFRIAVISALGKVLYGVVTDHDQQCTGGLSKESIFGWMLQGHIYKKMLADLPHACIFACSKDDRCQSLNWVISLLTCEFSNRTKEARPEDFIPNADRFYFKRDRNRVRLGSIRELPAETCHEIKSSEGQATSGKYWFSTIRSGTSILAYCDMETEGIYIIQLQLQSNGLFLKILEWFTFLLDSELLAVDSGSRYYIDECTTSHPVCDVNANCTNTQGSYFCTCKTGFSGDGKTCQDVDECVEGSHDCFPNFATCVNIPGSYNCVCSHSYAEDHTCLPAECVDYRRITNADRKVTYGKVSVQCDKTIDTAWYRFEGAAGTRMPTSCPPLYKCNTNAPGWLKGGHPSVEDGQVTRKACFHWSSCCSLSTNIKVRNCGSYYVYYLKSTGSCWYRYCSTD
ncbi:unnamed protein product [Porites evermanni]|uniref:EGF-like domain-containing protein n=1 Tax=Porites evermanni TaxID=104178 RepID=A0ABN8Q239_9CNID|nr:unnamed protein product [Porites evermanni]